MVLGLIKATLPCGDAGERSSLHRLPVIRNYLFDGESIKLEKCKVKEKNRAGGNGTVI
jgi:hypothetical protein